MRIFAIYVTYGFKLAQSPCENRKKFNFYVLNRLGIQGTPTPLAQLKCPLVFIFQINVVIRVRVVRSGLKKNNIDPL